jgi:hypothetical protein
MVSVFVGRVTVVEDPEPLGVAAFAVSFRVVAKV